MPGEGKIARVRWPGLLSRADSVSGRKRQVAITCSSVGQQCYWPHTLLVLMRNTLWQLARPIGLQMWRSRVCRMIVIAVYYGII